MDWMIFGVVIAWLGVVSWFDLRKNEIPHSAWALIPLVTALIYRSWLGDWNLALLSLLVAAVSEREHIAEWMGWLELKQIVSWLPVLFLGAYFALPISPMTTIAIFGFWLAWELGWWGGADASCAITLCLVWPEVGFLLAFLAAHLAAVLALGTLSLIRSKKISLHRIPGLPLLLASVLIYKASTTLF